MALLVIASGAALFLATTPNTLEILGWSMAAGTLFGAIITAWTAYDSWQELVLIRKIEPADTVLSAIAFANTRRDVFRTIKLLCLFLIAASVVAGYSNPYLGRTSLVLVIVLMVANSFLDRIERESTAETLRRRREQKEQE